MQTRRIKQNKYNQAKRLKNPSKNVRKQRQGPVLRYPVPMRWHLLFRTSSDYVNDPSARPQTRDLFKIESKTLLPGSGSQDLAAKMW